MRPAGPSGAALETDHWVSKLSITSGLEDMPTVGLGYNHPCWTVVTISQRVSWARCLMSPWKLEVRGGQVSTMDLHPGPRGDFPMCEMG